MTYPKLNGTVQISAKPDGVFIGGDPEGLSSLADMLSWLAGLDQEKLDDLPDGEREHIHLHSGSSLSKNSQETELCRLDAKGTGRFPEGCEPA